MHNPIKPGMLLSADTIIVSRTSVSENAASSSAFSSSRVNATEAQAPGKKSADGDAVGAAVGVALGAGGLPRLPRGSRKA